MKKIAVYGSLRKGRGNHRLIEHSNQLSQEVVSIPFRMVSLGGFPGLLPDEQDNDIVIEVYEVDDQTYKNVERLEGYPRFYQRTDIQTSQGEAGIYILEDPYYKDSPAVKSGDWNKQ